MRTKQILPLFLTGLAILFGYLAGKCGVSSGSCFLSAYFHDYVFIVFEPLYIFSLFSIPAVLLLPIVKKRVFGAWLRFSLIWILLSVAIIAWAPETSSSWFQLMSFVKEDAARLMGIFFSGLSLILLAWQTYMPERIRNAPL